MFFEPAIDDFSLSPNSPCVDAGNPSSPPNPDGTIADMGALYFDQGGGAIYRPGAPSDFTVEHNNAQLIASLSWINPNLTIMGEPLSELTGVLVYRNDELIADLTNVTMGAAYDYDDTSVPAPDMYEYEIVPYNSYGEGMDADASAWIGLDTPGEANDVIATPDPNNLLECTITWSEPLEGGNGGYWPPGSFEGQKIYRDGDEIADLPGINTSYVDDNIPIADFYSYGVSYYNDSGEGPIVPAFPDPVFVGPPQFEQIPYDWVEIGAIGTNTGITGDDQTLGPFDIGFNFPFYDNSYYSQIWVSSNGWVTFTQTTLTAYTNAAIPSSGAPNNLVCPFWDDLNPSQGGRILYYYDMANERFILEFTDIPHYSTGGNYTFEMILYPNGDIDFMYNELTPGTANSATVGIENADGSEGIQVTYNGSGPLEPEEEMGIRVYSVSPGIPAMSVTLTPPGTPIQIPAGGGTFDFDLLVENLEAFPVTFDFWTEAILPGGSVYPILVRPDVTLPGGGNAVRSLTQNVPAAAPPGLYSYQAYVGSHPDVVFAEDSFPFEKLTTGDSFNPDNSWSLYGWDGDAALTSLPIEFALNPPYPNPFNPETNLTFTIPEDGTVTLIIYDIQGREAALLVDEFCPAGYYQKKFKSEGLSSGVYFACLRANGFHQTRKLLLIK
ncbi:MAG: T9SS type A sorting domain-containing protein [candidate division Zixibacteria bacterium]|nr:T9SS type A sorting domain-containing protein [Candidatus Tariuqbacter arcticus]